MRRSPVMRRKQGAGLQQRLPEAGSSAAAVMASSETAKEAQARREAAEGEREEVEIGSFS